MNEYECRYFWQKEPADIIDRILSQPSHPADVKLTCNEIARVFREIWKVIPGDNPHGIQVLSDDYYKQKFE